MNKYEKALKTLAELKQKEQEYFDLWDGDDCDDYRFRNYQEYKYRRRGFEECIAILMEEE